MTQVCWCNFEVLHWFLKRGLNHQHIATMIKLKNMLNSERLNVGLYKRKDSPWSKYAKFGFYHILNNQFKPHAPVLKVKLRQGYKSVKLRQMSWVHCPWQVSWSDQLNSNWIITPGWKALIPAEQVLCNLWLVYLFDLGGELPSAISFCILLYIKNI